MIASVSLHKTTLPPHCMDDLDSHSVASSNDVGYVFDMDGDSASDVHAPGSDAHSPCRSVRTASTNGDDGGLIIDEVEDAQYVLSSVAAALCGDAPPLDRPDSSARASPRAMLNPSSVCATFSMNVTSKIVQHAEPQPQLTTTPTLGGRATTRTGSAMLPSTRLVIARASIAMRRCKVNFGTAKPTQCMFCSKPASIGHAVLTFSHVLGEEDQQYCGLNISLICSACAPIKISRDDAHARAFKTFNYLFLLRRFSFYINALQQMAHCPVPRLDCTYSTSDAKCVKCEKPVPGPVICDPHAILVLQNNKTKEVAVFAVCTYACRSDIEKIVLPAIRTCTQASRQLTEVADSRIYYSPTNGYWVAMPIQESRAYFPRGLMTTNTSIPYAIHGTCTNPVCFVCDCRQRNRTKQIGALRSHPSTIVRRHVQPDTKEKGREVADSGDNFRWLEAIIGLIKKENVLLDLLEEADDAACRGCGKFDTTLCRHCQAATLCSPECARVSRHDLVCVPRDAFWTEIMRH